MLLSSKILELKIRIGKATQFLEVRREVKAPLFLEKTAPRYMEKGGESSTEKQGRISFSRLFGREGVGLTIFPSVAQKSLGKTAERPSN